MLCARNITLVFIHFALFPYDLSQNRLRSTRDVRNELLIVL